jgi:hypothetical protein
LPHTVVAAVQDLVARTLVARRSTHQSLHLSQHHLFPPLLDHVLQQLPLLLPHAPLHQPHLQSLNLTSVCASSHIIRQRVTPVMTPLVMWSFHVFLATTTTRIGEAATTSSCIITRTHAAAHHTRSHLSHKVRDTSLWSLFLINLPSAVKTNANLYVRIACKKACDNQYTGCVNNYAESCKSNNRKLKGRTYAHDRGYYGSKYDNAMEQCKQQWKDCYAVNSNKNAGNRCSSYSK